MNLLTVYTVSTIDRSDPILKHGSRCVAVFTEFKDAEYAVQNNELDLAESGSNKYCVIEQTNLNEVYPSGEKRWWYVWDSENAEYVTTDCPKEYIRTVSFGIG